MIAPLDPWARAVLAADLLAVDPVGLGGLWLRARPGAARDRLACRFDRLVLPQRRLHPTMGDEALFGGIDLAASLAAGHSVERAGLLAAPAALTLAMAERCTPPLAVRLGQCLDRQESCLIALDEGAETDERPPTALTDRLGLFLCLDGLALADLSEIPLPDLAAARALLAEVACDESQLSEIAGTAAALGVISLRAPLFARAAARAHAALNGRRSVGPEDLQRAVELTLAHRARVLPEDAPAPPEDRPAPEPEPGAEREGQADEIPKDILLEAALAALPRDLLAQLAAGSAQRGSGTGGSGAARKGNRRGRPLPPRPGALDGRNRIALVATLAAAAPWQSLRRAQRPDHTGLHIRPADIRIRRYQETSDRLLIFTVDASGSAAMARLAEAKGAIELLLGEAYARRDHVALVAFRGAGAELLLPPTRSLVQTKRRLAALPGGGGTPLAAGLQCALDVAVQARGKGLTPSIALLTDGKANIALDGRADRAGAEADATTVARAIARIGLPGLVIDTARRPQEPLRRLAAILAAPYVPLPRADAHRISASLSAALES